MILLNKENTVAQCYYIKIINVAVEVSLKLLKSHNVDCIFLIIHRRRVFVILAKEDLTWDLTKFILAVAQFNRERNSFARKHFLGRCLDREYLILV